MRKLVLSLFLLLACWTLFIAICKAQEFESDAYLVFDTARDDWYPKTNLVADWPMLDAGAGLDQTLGRGDLESWQDPPGECSGCPVGFTCLCQNPGTTDIFRETSKIFKNSSSIRTTSPGAGPSTNVLGWTQNYYANSVYQISFWYRGAIGGVGEALGVALANVGGPYPFFDTPYYDFTNDNWSVLATFFSLANAPAAWTRVVLYVKIGVSDRLGYRLTFEGSSGNQTVYIDNIQIQKLHALGPTSSVGTVVTLLPPVTADPLFTQTPYGTMKQGPSTPYPWGTTFDGVNDYVSCSDATCGSWADPALNFSVGCYQVIPNSLPALARVIGKRAAANNGWDLFNAAGTGHIQVYKTLIGDTDVSIAGCFETTKATNLVSTYTNLVTGASLLNLYCDQTTASSAIAVAPIAGNAEDIKVGGAAGEYMPGSIGRCAFWNRALTATEAKSYTYPHFPPNSYATTTYVRACTQAVPEATCWQDKCRNAKANTCAVEPTGVFGAFLSNTELLRDNSFEAYTFAPTPDGTFAAHVDYAMTGDGREFTLDDLDGDAYPDIVVGRYGGNVASVLLNADTGAGTFNPKVDYITNSFVASVATGNFTGVGNRDLAASTENMMLSILLNNGAGVFGAKTDYATGMGEGVATGDFNSDGYDDVVVAEFNHPHIGVFINNALGLGVFLAKVEYGTNTQPYDVTVADLRGTGVKDIIVTNSGSANMSVFLGDGDGTFDGTARADYVTGTTPTGVVVGNFDGVGLDDIAVTNSGSNTVSIFLSNGVGTFAAKVDYATGNEPRNIAVGDFRNTGKDDLAIAARTDNQLNILFNDGDGTFTANANYATNNQPWGVVVADTRQNGVSDVVVSNGDAKLNVFLGDAISADDSNPTLTRWTIGETGGGDVTTYHANNRHGLTTIRLKTVGVGTASVTSTCQTIGVGSDLFVYGSVNKLSSTAAFSIDLNEYSDGACVTLIGTTAIKSTSDLFARWQTVTKHIIAADWDPTPTASYTLTFKETGAAGITTDILLDTVSAKAQKYYTPWVENPSGSVTTTASARVLDLDNPLAPIKYAGGFCAGGWVWTDWDGTNTDALRYFMSVPATGGFLNKWAIYYAIAPSVRLGFEVYTSGPGNYRVYRSGIGATEWSAHNWKYIEACYKPSPSSLTRVIKARHYNVANATWYDWSTTDHTGNFSQNGQSTTLSIGQAVGVGQPNAYFHQPYILPYSATYPDTFFNNGKPPALPYGSFNND